MHFQHQKHFDVVTCPLLLLSTQDTYAFTYCHTYLYINICSIADKYMNTLSQILVNSCMKGCQTIFVLYILIGSLLTQFLQYSGLLSANSACINALYTSSLYSAYTAYPCYYFVRNKQNTPSYS